MTAYYNEIDPFAAQWLRNLIAAGHIAPGEVDERSLLDVCPDDLAGFTQCHFFAGIGVWSYALRQAGWPDSRPVWTGSCPCQPFSVAGVGGGFDDERHLWPFWFHLIEQRRPPVVFGEQVEAAIKHGWLDLVQSDLEGIGYAVAPISIPAAGVGAPHIRQRLWFVADTNNQRRAGGLDDTDDEGLEGLRSGHQAAGGRFDALRSVAQASESCGLEHAGSSGRNGRETPAPEHDDDRAASEWSQGEHGIGVASAHRLHQHGAGPTNGFWRDADWLLCRDGKWRPVEPGASPLALGATARVGRLRAYGNAIVAQVAAQIVNAYLEAA